MIHLIYNEVTPILTAKSRRATTTGRSTPTTSMRSSGYSRNTVCRIARSRGRTSTSPKSSSAIPMATTSSPAPTPRAPPLSEAIHVRGKRQPRIGQLAPRALNSNAVAGDRAFSLRTPMIAVALVAGRSSPGLTAPNGRAAIKAMERLVGRPAMVTCPSILTPAAEAAIGGLTRRVTLGFARVRVKTISKPFSPRMSITTSNSPVCAAFLRSAM